MESERVRPSTSAHAPERGIGDPPNLGRIERMGGTTLRRSRGKSDRERGSSSGKRHRHGTKVLRGGTLLIAFVTILVMVAIFGGWMRNRQQQSDFTEFELLAKPRVVDRIESRFKSPSEEEARVILTKALAAKDEAAVRENFHLAASTPDEVLAFLRDQEEHKGPLRVDNWLGSIDPNNTLVEGLVVKRSKEDGSESSTIAMLTPDQTGVWRLDFDSFAGKCQPSWEAFVSGEAVEGVVRVWFSVDNYFNGPFLNDEQWLCYSMARSESDAILFGYCRKGSPQADAMENIAERMRMKGRTNTTSFRGIVAISKPEGAEKRQFEIKRVLAEDWLLTDKAFDGSPEPVK